MDRPIYLDHHATTPCDPRVVEAMLPWFSERYGNAGSRGHLFGSESQEAVERARAQVAGAVDAAPEEVVFTSGATEALNLAIAGVAGDSAIGGGPPRGGDHFVTQITEHPAVLEPLRRLERHGARVTRLGVDERGRLDPDAVSRAIVPGTRLVAVMAANNEIGTLQPVAEIGRICRERGALLLVDAAQAPATLPVGFHASGADLLALSGHKAYGPKGTGALVIRKGVRVEPQILGGGQERGLRSGTQNVPGIVGLGAAFAIAAREQAADALRIGRLRDRLQAALAARLGDLRFNGDPGARLPGNLSVSFGGVEGDALLLGLRGIAVSTGSACASVRPEPSPVLRALGLPPALCLATLRFGLGRGTTEEEVDRAADLVVARVDRLRGLRRAARAPRSGRGQGSPLAPPVP